MDHILLGFSFRHNLNQPVLAQIHHWMSSPRTHDEPAIYMCLKKHRNNMNFTHHLHPQCIYGFSSAKQYNASKRGSNKLYQTEQFNVETIEISLARAKMCCANKTNVVQFNTRNFLHPISFVYSIGNIWHVKTCAADILKCVAGYVKSDIACT